MESNHMGDSSRSPSAPMINPWNHEIFDGKPSSLLHVDHHENIIINRGGGGGGVGGGRGGGGRSNIISIAERRAEKCGFNVRNMNVQPRFLTRTTHTLPHLTSPMMLRSPYFTVPPGISPSVLLDSPVMLPNSQGAQLSPTTGTFQFPSPNDEKLKLKWKLAANGNMDPCSVANNYIRPQNKTVEKFFEHPVDLQENNQKKECIEKQQKGAYFPKEVTRSSEDGYYWRKYGQKHVKGSEYPRSYYKCTHTNCLVKKKVERSHDGHITEIVYKGSHNHPKPQPLKRFGVDVLEINNESPGPTLTRNVGLDSTAGLNGAYSSNPLIQSAYSLKSDPLPTMKGFEALEFSVEDQDVGSPESISFHDEDDDQNGESESKKRKRESFPIETSISRSTREPRVVVQIESDIDILDDGYRWRKYGQKVVKGNPNPRSYYKCTSPGCPVRKHVERAANDLKSVITTYEGKHNHEVPVAAAAAAAAAAAVSAKNTGTGLVPQTDHQLPQARNSIMDFSSSTTSINAPNQGQQLVQHLPPPLYNFNKTKSFIFNYNDHHLIMRSNPNMASTTTGNNILNFGSSSANYPVSFPPFHYGSLLMNGNFIKNYPTNSTNLYPMSTTANLPEYMSTMTPVQAAGSAVNGGNFHIRNYTSADCDPVQEISECHVKVMKPKEEKRDEGDHIYNACLPIPNHGNGIM